MNCNEIHSYFDRQDQVPGPRASAANVAGHLRTCPTCRDEFQGQIELLGILNLVRDSVPATSPSLDADVLQNFRKRASNVPASKVVLFFRQPANTLLWRGAIAAAVVLAAIVVFVSQRSTAKPPIEASRIVPQASAQRESNPAQPVSSNSTANSSASMNPRPNRRSARNATQSPTPAANQRNPQPVAFNGLMYCDSLTCSEGMEVIRMQLPSPPAQLADTNAQNPVYADVIVGPDGIARGYRIVR